MPPAVSSDSESDFETNEPVAAFKKSPAKKKASPTPEPSDEDFQDREVDVKNGDAHDDEDEDEDEDDDDEEVYIVEKIVNHTVERGSIIYQVKWKGYSSQENTWEPEDNLDGAMDILENYFTSIGGRPVDGSKPKDKKRGRKSASANSSDPPAKKVKTEVPVRKGRPPRGLTKADESEEEKVKWPIADDSWKPPKVEKDSWEDILLSVEAIHQDEHPKNKDAALWAYVEWAVLDDNGKRRTSKVLLESVHKAAPQAAIKFYKSHLAFVDNKSK